MRVTRRAAAIVSLTLLVLGSSTWWFLRLPEPSHGGLRLWSYLEEFDSKPGEALAATRALGSSAVPFLVQQMKRDQVYETLSDAAMRLPGTVAPIIPERFNPLTKRGNAERFNYLNRQAAASTLLRSLGTNAVSAVPLLLESNLTNDFDLHFLAHSVDLIGKLAPETEYESNAVIALLRVVATNTDDYEAKALKKAAYKNLGSFTASRELVIPILITGLYEPGMSGPCIEGLVKFGTNAIPALREASRSETNHVRPATVALQQIEKNSP